MIINNVKLVLENEVVHGSLEVQDGEIRAFAESQSRLPEAMDGEGGWLLPGLIELHTDNLDKFFTPRPKVDWPAHSAMSSHDALMVASGITTVLDAVAIGDVRDGGDRLENLEKMINAIEETQKRGVNRAEHRLHLRCELPHHTTLPLFEKLAQLGLLDILSSDYYPASLLDAAFRVADDQSNRFTLPQAVRLVTKNPAQALNLQDRGVIGEGNRADLVLAHRKGNHIHIDTSGVRVKGCSDDGKTDLVNGAVRLRERQPAGGTPPAGTGAATGGASLHHARCQRWKRKPYRPERAGVFYPRGAKSAGLKLARQRSVLWRRRRD